MKILHVPNSILTTPVKQVTSIDKKLLKIIAEMIATLKIQKDPEGGGLAAPQVGIPLQLFVIRPKKVKKANVFINPEFVGEKKKEEERKKKEEDIRKEENDEAKLEGCLSIPRIWGQVDRNPQVDIKYQNEKGETVQKHFSGFEAVVIQHEMDHLQGILFTQRVLEQNGKLYKEEEGELKKYEI